MRRYWAVAATLTLIGANTQQAWAAKAKKSSSVEKNAAMKGFGAELVEDGRDVALELRRLVYGDLRGMFDGPTTPGIDLAGPLVVLDLSAVYHSPALGVLMACAASWLQSAVTAVRRDRILLVVDEAWAILGDLGVARWLQASWKLSRAHGVANMAVLHRLSDLRAVGAAGSEQVGLAEGLLSDSETRVVYAQPHGEVAATADLGYLNIPTIFIAVLAALSMIPSVWASPSLRWSVLGAAGVLFVADGLLYVSARSQRRTLDVDFVARRPHYLQAILQSFEQHNNGAQLMLLDIEKLLILKTVPIFAEAPDYVLAQVIPILEEQEFEAGQRVFDKGDLGTSMYIIVSGKVRVHIEERELTVLGERQVFGELALLDPEPRSASVTAIEPTLVFRISQSAIYDLMASHVEIVRGIMRVLCRRIRQK